MLNAGTQTNSLVNHLYSRMTKGQPRPEIGMGATLLQWTDRHAATITSVFNEGKYLYIGVKRDIAKRIDGNGFSEMQEYNYTTNNEASEKFFRFDGQFWKSVYKSTETNRWKKTDGGIRIGTREEYYDHSF